MNLHFIDFINLTELEHQKILNIRNTKDIRKQMKTDDIIELKNHLKWLNSLKNNKKKLYYAVFIKEDIIGCIDITSMDTKTKTTSWGFYFKKDTNPLIISICVYIIIEKIFYEHKMEKIVSEVKKTNQNGYKFNISFGFLPIYEDNSYFFLELKKEDWEKNKLHKLKKRVEKIGYKFA